MLRLSLVGGLLTGFSLPAAPVKFDYLSSGSIVYTNCTVLGANTTDLFFTHKHGISNIKLRQLDAETQKLFNYDAGAARQAEQRQADEHSAYQKYVATRVPPRPPATAKAAGSGAPEVPAGPLADPISEKSLLGKRAPKLDVQKWISDQPDTDEKFVLVHIWTPSSPASRRYISELNGVQKSLAAKLVVVGLTSASENDVLDMEGTKLEFASAIDPKARFTTAMGVTSVPTVVLLDPKGVVVYQGHPSALNEATLKSIVEAPAE